MLDEMLDDILDETLDKILDERLKETLEEILKQTYKQFQLVNITNMVLYNWYGLNHGVWSYPRVHCQVEMTGLN